MMRFLKRKYSFTMSINFLHINFCRKNSIVCLTVLKCMVFKLNQVHLEICSDVNDACCDTCMDSMANDFRGEN